MAREIETGILSGGLALEGTGWCLREPSAAWWDPRVREDRYQMRPRESVVDLLCGHWTAGEASTRSYDDDGERVVRVMKRRMSRKRPDRRLKVSVHFVIGACNPEDAFAPVWQTMDLVAGGFSAVHVGRPSVNARSIGVEVVSAGLDGAPNVRDRPEVEVELLGRRRVLDFYPGQIRSWVRLANALSGACLPGGIEIPRVVPAELDEDGRDRPLSRRLRAPELRQWSGAMEHYLMDNTTKVDAGTLLLRALLDAGWGAVRL